MYKRNAPSQVAKRPIKRVKFSKQLNERAYKVSPISRVELKAVANWIDGVAPLTGATYSVGKVALGDQYNERNGRAVRHISADLYYTLIKPAGIPAVTYRVIYGIWKQSYDTRAPAINEILDTNFYTGSELYAPINPLNASNLVILMDELHSVNPGYNTSGVAAGSPGEAKQSYKRKFPYAAVQEYIGDDGDDVRTWNHFIMCVSDNSGSLVAISTQHYYTDA